MNEQMTHILVCKNSEFECVRVCGVYIHTCITDDDDICIRIELI